MQVGSGTELEPETGTVGTVFPETERGTGTAGTIFQEPKQNWVIRTHQIGANPEKSDLVNFRNRRNRFPGTETGTGTVLSFKKLYWSTEKPFLGRNRRNRKPEPLEPFHPRTVTEPSRTGPPWINFFENILVLSVVQLFLRMIRPVGVIFRRDYAC